MLKVLVYGHSGWIGSKICILLKDLFNVIPSCIRLENYCDIINEISSVKPNYVINCAGLTGRPNIDWLEDNKIISTQINIISAAILADICYRNNIHYTYIGTGCIYEYDEMHHIPNEINDAKGFLETDKPNFDKSFYSFGKIMTENITKQFSTSLILRIRMPISDDLNERNFITKISKYPKVINIPNSMSVLSDLLPLIPKMLERKLTGVYNFVNPGVISHVEVLELYKKYINQNFEWTVFSIEEQSKVIKAPRSNNYLDSSKLLNEFPDIPNIKIAVENCFKRMIV